MDLIDEEAGVSREAIGQRLERERRDRLGRFQQKQNEELMILLMGQRRESTSLNDSLFLCAVSWWTRQPRSSGPLMISFSLAGSLWLRESSQQEKRAEQNERELAKTINADNHKHQRIRTH